MATHRRQRPKRDSDLAGRCTPRRMPFLLEFSTLSAKLCSDTRETRMIKDRALAVTVCGLLFAAACGDDGSFSGPPCEDDTNCNLSGGGKCLLAPSSPTI